MTGSASETTSLTAGGATRAEEDYGGTQNGDVDDEEDPFTVDETIVNVTRRLRCLFATITWPIVPLGTLVSLGLLWVLYAAFVSDVRSTCSHPLHGYAIVSFLSVMYAPFHGHVRSYLFRYSRERDGPIRPARVRVYDQLFHTFCVLYVYGGVTLIQACKDDFGDHNMAQNVGDKGNSTDPFTSELLNTCDQTCPYIFQATQVYVTLLEFFTLSLILPLLFLPCIYLYILRRANDENGTLQQLQERLEEEDFLGRSTRVSAQELMDSLEAVQLISRGGLKLVSLAVSQSADERDGKQVSDTMKECCICMNDFEVTEQDVEAQHVLEDEAMVRTKCGHVFHKKCLAGWIGGRWDPQDHRRRRARRTNCPLCREDLKPITGRRSSEPQTDSTLLF
jgi:hypothetical protein